MSYFPSLDDQDLEYPMKSIIEGIEAFEKATTNRIASNDHLPAHVDRIISLVKEMKDLEFKLRVLKTELYK